MGKYFASRLTAFWWAAVCLTVVAATCAGEDSSPLIPPLIGGSSGKVTAGPIQDSGPRAAVASVTPVSFQVKTEVVASGLIVPWALAFPPKLPGATPETPSGPYILVTERPGRLRLIANGRLLSNPVATLPVAAQDEAGLLGLALDPRFEQNGHLFVMYSYQSRSGLRNRISRLTLAGTSAGGERILLDDIPTANIHGGGRLKFGPDGKLYATQGTVQPDLAQRRDSLEGKILRLNPDGSVPQDNPFPSSLVYSYGHRNPQGLAWQSGSGRLFSTEHGPSSVVDGNRCCHDELNVIRPGANYGWPIVSGSAGDPRFVDPILESKDSTWAPSGVVFYDATQLAPWRGSLFFGALRGRHLHRVTLAGANGAQVTGEERLFDGVFGRIRDVAAGPDGALYLTTSNRDFRGPAGPDDDRVVRIVPGP